MKRLMSKSTAHGHNGLVLSFNPLLVFGLFCLVSLIGQAASANPAAQPQTIADAIARVRAITDPDPQRQAYLRTLEAKRIIENRIKVTNDLSGLLLQTLPVDFWNDFNGEGKLKTRDEVIEIARTNNWDMAEVSWMLQAGRCNEHAELMQRILTGAGVNVAVLMSESPHVFTVVNIAPDYDPDIPWTWGDKFILADSWSGQVLTSPRQVWDGALYFRSGSLGVGLTTFTTRRKIKHMVKRGPQFLKDNCALYRKLYTKFMTIPPDVRATIGDTVVDRKQPVSRYPAIVQVPVFNPPDPDTICGPGQQQKPGTNYRLIEVRREPQIFGGPPPTVIKGARKTLELKGNRPGFEAKVVLTVELPDQIGLTETFKVGARAKADWRLQHVVFSWMNVSLNVLARPAGKNTGKEWNEPGAYSVEATQSFDITLNDEWVNRWEENGKQYRGVGITYGAYGCDYGERALFVYEGPPVAK